MTERTTSPGNQAIRCEARGPHWVAWIADANGNPEGSVVMVAGTREEAEARAREWAEKNARR